MAPTPTRQRILDAALAAFAAHGPAGARVDEIAAAAQVNKRMLYHHFGDKAGLFRAVVAERVLTALEPPPEAGDTAWLADVHLDVWRVLAWQREPWDLEPVRAALTARQQQGELRRDISPETMALCLVSAYVLPGLLGVNAPQARSELAELFAATPSRRSRPRLRAKPVVMPRS